MRQGGGKRKPGGRKAQKKVRTVAEHFVVGALTRARKEHADFEVDGALLLLQDEQLLLDLGVCRRKCVCACVR